MYIRERNVLRATVLFCLCLACIVGLVTVELYGTFQGGKGCTEECEKDYRLEVASAKVYYQTGGRYWINPFTLKLEPTPDYVK